MKKVYFFLFTLIGVVLNSLAQQYNLTGLGSPSVLRSQDITNKLIENNYVSEIRNSPQGTMGLIPDKTAYAFMLDNNETPENMGLISFNMLTPHEYSIVRDADFSNAIYTGVCVEEVYYAFMVRFSASGFAFPTELATIDLTTGEKKTVCSLEHLGQTTFNDMTYDYSTGTVYAIANTEGMFKSGLYTFSLTDGTYKKIGVMDGTYMMCIACNYEGQLYGIGTGGGLYKIDKNSGKMELVGNTGYMPWYIQSMEFDHTENKLYWAGADAEHTFFALVDTEYASAMEIGTFTDYTNMTGLYIPFTRVKPGGPGKVTDMTVTPGQKGEFNATIKWKNPLTDPFGNTLTGNMGIRVYRDSELIANMTGKKPGEECEFYDNEIISRGDYTFRLVTYNETSEGESVKRKIWIGDDIPASPVDISMEVRKGNIHLSWRIPEVGKNGGWVNHAQLKSKVYCVNDNNRLVAETNNNECVDDKLQTLKKWSYRIVVMDSDDNSSETVTDYIMAGPALDLPFHDDFQTDNFNDMWSVVNINNDTLLWKRATSALDPGNYFMQYIRSYYTPANEIAFAPPVNMSVGKDYKISMDTKVIRMGYATEENLAVIISTSPNLSVKADTIAKFTMLDYEKEWNRKEFMYSPKTDGVYYAGIYLYSKANQNYVCIDNWKMEEVFYYDLQAVSVSGASSALTGIGSEYDVTVFNKGSKDVPSYTILLVDDDGNPLSEEVKINETIKSGETKTHTLMWIPTGIGKQTVAFKVRLDGDGDETNNVSPSINVNVQSSSVYETQMGESQGVSNIPFAQDFRGPVYTQSIYNRKEINSINGLIKELTWYTQGIEVLPAEMDVKIYLANTDKTNFTDGEIPLENMTLVYSGKINIANAKQTEIKIVLDNAFLYNGKNLAVHVAKLSQGRETYGWRNGFNIYYENGNTAPSIFVNSLNSKSIKEFKPVLKMKLNSSGNKVYGKVTDNSSKPVGEVEVSIPSLGMKTKTDANGVYTFDLVNMGEYQIKYSLKGYFDLEDKITVPETINTPVMKNVTLTKMETCNFTFTVTDTGNNPVSGAEVSFEGYDQRKATTGADGKVVLEDFVRESYSVTVTADNYQTYNGEVGLKGNSNTSASCKLMPNAYPVTGLTVEPNSNTVSWEQPVRINNIRYDNGEIAARCGLGTDETNEFCVFGVKMEQAGTIKKIKWYLYGDPGDKERTINLYVFNMGEDGYPENEPIYSNKGIVSELNKWVEYKVERELNAEKPFFVALSCSDSYLGLGIDSGSQEGEYAFRPMGNFFTSDYRTHYYYASIWYKGNFMLRADVIEQSNATLPTANLIEGYNLYRLRAEDLENKEKWENISSQTGTSFRDSEFASLPQGYYMYAVTARWKGAGESDAEFSDVIEKDMMTKVTVKVTANISGTDVLDGTEVRLKSKTGKMTYSETLQNGNKTCVFEKVEKGTYVLSIRSPRFDILSEEVSPDSESEYTFGEYKLVESLTEPVNLLAEEKEENSGVYAVNWNKTTSIFEDFESHKDFALNSPGKIGWGYLDNDSNPDTYGLSANNQRVQYDNWGERTAYIIFNPSATDPRSDSSAELSPWSGDKFLGSFSSSKGANDDLIISPKLFFNEDFTFSFYAKSYTTVYGADRMMVGYSETDTEPESFVWIQDGEFTIMTSFWNQYSYTVPSSAKYVCIRCVSDNAFLFMVDDIQIGEESKPYSTFAKSYEVYLDDKMIGTTEDCNYVVTAGVGPHTIGIKAIYESGKSEMATVRVGESESSISNARTTSVLYADRKLLFDGTAQTISVYSVSGDMVRNYANARNTVYIDDIESGFYIAVVVINGKEHVVKFIIEQ